MKKEVAQFDRIWSAITEASTDLLKKGVDVSDIISNLRSIRALINLCDNHNSPNPYYTNEIASHIRYELRNVEDILVIEAANKIGMDYADQLSEKLLHAWIGKTPMAYLPTLNLRRKVKYD